MIYKIYNKMENNKYHNVKTVLIYNKYHTVKTVPIYNRTRIERDKFYTTNTLMHDHSLPVHAIQLKVEGLN
jgi:hypothetical protein